MTRSEIIATFRAENPELPQRVLSTTNLESWCKEANKEICIRTRCIVGYSTITSTADKGSLSVPYVLTTDITNFYDIDEYPGGGVSYDGERMDVKSIAELDEESSGWRSADAGTPTKYARRGQNLYFDVPTEASKTIEVFTILLPNDFDADDEEPFNETGYLQGYGYAIVLYLKQKAKNQIGKPDEALTAKAEYEAYLQRMAGEIANLRYGQVHFRIGERS